MRCSVCGKDRKYHRVATWALQKRNSMGKWESLIVADAPKCTVIQAWQNQLIYGGTMRIWRVPTPKQIGA